MATGDLVERFASYDAHGNILRSAAPPKAIAWDHANQLRMSRAQSGRRRRRAHLVCLRREAATRLRKVTEDARGAVTARTDLSRRLRDLPPPRLRPARPARRCTSWTTRTRVALVETRVSRGRAGEARAARPLSARGPSRPFAPRARRARPHHCVEEYSPWRSTTWQAVRSRLRPQALPRRQGA